MAKIQKKSWEQVPARPWPSREWGGTCFSAGQILPEGPGAAAMIFTGSPDAMGKLFSPVTHGVLPEQHGDAPHTRQRHQRIDDPAEHGSLAAKQPGHGVKLEQADASPVEGADDHQDQSEFVQHFFHSLSVSAGDRAPENPLRAVFRAAPFRWKNAEKLKKIKVNIVVHIILGLPGETKEDMLETVKYVCHSGINGIKLQLLHIIKGTDLEKEYLSGKVKPLEFEEYLDIIKSCVEIIPENIVIHRLTGDGAKKDLVAPLWSADKKRVLNSINKILSE